MLAISGAPAAHPITARGLLARYLGPRLAQVALLAALLLGNHGLQLVSPQVVRFFIDTAREGGDLQTLAAAGLLFLGMALVSQVLGVAETTVAAGVGWSATNELRADLTRHCLELDMPFHHAHPPGVLIERVDGDVNVLRNFFSRFVVSIAGGILLLGGALALLVREDWRIGLFIAAMTAVSLVVLLYRRGIMTRYAVGRQQAGAELFGFVEERLGGLPDIQANGTQPHVLDQLHGRLRTLFWWVRRGLLVGGALQVASGGLGIFTGAAMLAATAYLFGAGAMTLGSVYLVLRYSQMASGAVHQIARQLRDFERAGASVTRVRDLYAAPRSVQDGPGIALPAGPLAVELRGVSFDYGPPATPAGGRFGAAGIPDSAPDAVLREVSFRLEPGRVLGVVGRTGSGKSTLTRLLVRLYDPGSGEVRVGDVDVRRVRQDELRARIGTVTQEVQLFGATVRDNVALFDRRVPDGAIVSVLEELGLAPWLATLPAGLDSVLGAGGGLSAGEQQLLAFARVFLRDPGLVILDEASSRLDPATERLVEHAVDRLLAGRTAIVVAHRLSTVERADEIMVLEDGRIVEHGPRAALWRDAASRYGSLLGVAGGAGSEVPA